MRYAIFECLEDTEIVALAKSATGLWDQGLVFAERIFPLRLRSASTESRLFAMKICNSTELGYNFRRLSIVNATN